MTVNQKAIKIFAAGAAAGAATAAALAATKSKQEHARAEGRHVPYGPYEAVVKRPLDALLASAALISLSPVMAATALAVRVKLGNPIIFEQERPGIDGKTFNLYKFRSMSNARDAEGNLLPDAQRLTKFGKILRSTSLDELPELFNIAKGDMSVVGPRPLLVRYLDHYDDFEMRRHDVRPGLTGLAQISGRNALTWKEKFQKDVEYVGRITFMGDARIVFLTAKKTIAREGIEFTEGHQTITEYFNAR